MIFYLHPELQTYFSTSVSLFDQLMNLKGEIFRHQKNRMTQRIILGEKTYFIKQYNGIGLKEVLKNLLCLRWPVFSASHEWRALSTCRQLGLAVPQVLAYGCRGWNPIKQQSFILMEALIPTKSVEELMQDWQTKPPTFNFKQQLIQRIANITSTLHHAGINHRDLYICHFLLFLPIQFSFPQLYLIDLHRAQMRSCTPRRWVIKDLAALYFSSKGAGLTKRDLYRFIKNYLGISKKKCLHDVFRTQYAFWQKVERRGEQLYRDHS